MTLLGGNLHGKIVKLKIYYELNDLAGIKLILENINHVFKKKELQECLMRVHKNFIFYFNKLTKLKFENVKDNNLEAALLQDQLANDIRWISRRTWFNEKLTEMLEGRKK